MIFINNNNIKEKNLKVEVDFLKNIPPFNGLADQDMNRLLQSLKVKEKLLYDCISS